MRHSTNAILHPWLKGELKDILASLPTPIHDPAANRPEWERWQEGLTVRINWPEELPPLRMLLVLDNLKDHPTPSLVLWLFANGKLPLYTP